MQWQKLPVGNMSQWKTIADIRREYGNLNLSEQDIDTSPIVQFQRWFSDALEAEKTDPTAMVLSTVDERGRPDSRVVLLKGLDDQRFVFYTNYQSAKALQLHTMPYAALNFYWPQMARQVRIRGQVHQTTASQSDTYFASRPILSQLSAICSPQSQEISGRAELEECLKNTQKHHQQKPIERPPSWGGYQVIPETMEFWQGRDNRLHDRIQYHLAEGRWMFKRLAP
jgi:pyridoxamine 5'-phosphate oxidase